MHKLRYRQVHLDFHTSPAIDGIGTNFKKEEWQEALRAGHLDSITCFASGHHGWSYYDTKIGKRHPHLSFDLLRAQFDAAKEIDVNVPIYLTAGIHNVMAEAHPEWREMGYDGKHLGWGSGALQAGFRNMCFNTPYLDHLCEQIEEVVALFLNADGIFLDIISQGPCCCRYCMESMKQNGLDPEKEEDRLVNAKLVLDAYYERTTAAAHVHDPEMPVFHNSGHITCGKRDILKHFSHLELESLPTGGWGYDHFPISAKYCHNLPLDFLGMTGKFHTTWGEFGGYKHPNALRYECAAMLAYGAKCSVGDQLHPSGKMDMSTYKLIGAAYAEVEAKEAWCVDACNVADIGLLSSAAVNRRGTSAGDDVPGDVGAGRVLLEGHFLFDVLDAEMDFGDYKVLVLPDGRASLLTRRFGSVHRPASNSKHQYPSPHPEELAESQVAHHASGRPSCGCCAVSIEEPAWPGDCRNPTHPNLDHLISWTTGTAALRYQVMAPGLQQDLDGQRQASRWSRAHAPCRGIAVQRDP